MKNAFSDVSSARNDQLPEEVIEQEENKPSAFFEWWFKWTAVPEPPASASFVKREGARKARLLSIILLFFLPTLVLVLPTSFFIPIVAVRYVVVALICAASISLLLNRVGQVVIAAIVLAFGFEAALTVVVLLTNPLDETVLQLYDLYTIAELFAVSLLPVRSVFLIAVCNSVFFWFDLSYQKHVAFLGQDLTNQFIPIVSRPIILQLIVAAVAFLWVSSATKAIMRADRAEMVAKLEHALVDQKRKMEEGIDQLLRTHVEVANGNLNARAPLNQENVLWQIARALNTLLVRLQRASVGERDLRRVEHAVTQCVNIIQQAERQERLPRLPFTHTALDPLIAALQGKTLAFTQPPFLQRKHSTQGEATISAPPASTYKAEATLSTPPVSPRKDGS
jgi:hypothetical protein